MDDGVGQHEGARAVVHGDEGELLGHCLDAPHGRLLPQRPRGDDLHRRRELVGLDGELPILVHAGGRRNDHDEPDLAHGIERLEAPREQRLAAHRHELLAPRAAETLPGAARHHHGGDVGLLPHVAAPLGGARLPRRLRRERGRDGSGEGGGLDDRVFAGRYC